MWFRDTRQRSSIYHQVDYQDIMSVVARCGHEAPSWVCSFLERRRSGIRVCKRCSPDLQEPRRLLRKASEILAKQRSEAERLNSSRIL